MAPTIRSTVQRILDAMSGAPAYVRNGRGRAQRPLPPDRHKRLHHPIVGELELGYEVMELAGDAGLTLAVYSAEPASRSQEALELLAGWTATPEPTEQRLRGEPREH